MSGVVGHRPEYATNARSGRVTALCSCDHLGAKPFTHQWEAEDYFNKHVEQVERAKAALSRRTPTLASQAAYYREQQKATDDPVAKAQWRMLAEGLEARIKAKRDDDQLPLF